MERKIIFLINPISGTRNKVALRPAIEKACYAKKISFQFADTDKNGKYDWLCEKIPAEQITDVVVCGGDGSISQVAGCLLKVKVNLGIIPLGSGNGLAFTAGISSNVEKALAVIVAGKAAYIDAFRINDQFSCMLCGIGFDAQVAHDFAMQSSRGLFTYVKETIRNFITAKPFLFQIIADERKIEAESFFISIANSNQFGNNFTIAPQASLSDGWLDIVIVKKMHKLKMVFSIFRHIRFGRVLPVDDINDAKDIIYFKSKSLSIKNLENAPLHIDGEPSNTSPAFNIEIIEKAFLLLQP